MRRRTLIGAAVVLRLLALAFLALGILAAPVIAAAQPIDPTPRVAVASAFAPELDALLEATAERETIVLNNVAFTTGVLEGKPVVLFLSGVSTVNAAMTTQMALDHFTVTSIAFSGIAGGVDPALKIGDVVVAERWSPYFDVFIAREGAGGGPELPGFFTPTLPPFGVMYPRGVSVFAHGEHSLDTRMWFDVDPALLKIVETVAGSVTLDPCAAPDQCLSHQPQVVVGGPGVSGSAFVDNAAFREYVHATFGARLLDMESAAVAQVAFTNETPFIAFRSLSDLAGGGEGENEIGVFFGLAARNAAVVVRAYLKALE